MVEGSEDAISQLIWGLAIAYIIIGFSPTFQLPNL